MKIRAEFLEVIHVERFKLPELFLLLGLDVSVSFQLATYCIGVSTGVIKRE